jgi:translation initiation factor IF-1
MSGDTFTADGVVVTCQRSGYFLVRLDNGHEVLCRPSGRIHRPGHPMIRIQLEDKMTVEMNAYDLSRGRIVWRSRDD